MFMYRPHTQWGLIYDLYMHVHTVDPARWTPRNRSELILKPLKRIAHLIFFLFVLIQVVHLVLIGSHTCLRSFLLCVVLLTRAVLLWLTVAVVADSKNNKILQNVRLKKRRYKFLSVKYGRG